MKVDDARRDLARLLPDPAGRDLPAGRELALKEHLMSEVRIADRPTAGTPAKRRRRKPTVIIAAAVAVAVAATLALLPRNTPGASPAAMRLLAKIAAVAAAQPSPHVRSNQFSYIRAWVSNQVCEGGSGSNCVVTKPYETQVWMSVSNQCVTGLLREDGQNTPLTFSTNYLHCPYAGGVHDPTYRFLQSLPTNPQALLSLIEREMQGQLPRPEEAFTTIGDLLGGAIAPPAVSAALYRAAALIPGVTVVADATDAIGRHGVAVAFTYQGTRTEWIFSRQTLLYLGSRSIDLANGSTTGDAAVLQRGFVDHVGQLPG
ncbi:MAG TPA: CU044_5270 family protein [Streptosporangiaceae bacterium]|nr:CU044_5270 family protein [Streptosporangiaceae bacterium]